MTKIVGILNITPDSFSDGGRFENDEIMLKHLQKMLEDGADVIDVGAESTRPGAVALSTDEEWLRLSSKLIKIVDYCKQFYKKTGKKVETSIDSYHFENIVKAVEIGFDVVNDVSGLVDEKVIEFIAKTGVKTVLMHCDKIDPRPETVVNKAFGVSDKIIDWARLKIRDLTAKGVKKSQLIFDPGIGFGKDAEQSIRILKNVVQLQALDLPIYIGHSKKSFLDNIYRDWNLQDLAQKLGLNAQKLQKMDEKSQKMAIRAQKTLEVSRFLVKQKVDFIRVHDVVNHVEL